MSKNCNNCAWFCHANGACYGTEFMLTGQEIGVPIFAPADKGACKDWTFDGLEDWEREQTGTLVTMEAA